ncbi:chaperone modulator CbpM [Phaeovulum sp.]|uniref:chaperone modulator CbpM n=1 Tax=Phaeovulum sp. TaxID=2934796 RepID=UPI002731F24D|nr:chaperone modulator CbpM [Phaeovulum sp.]MDP1668341.1 chaperone modulator CbpM [Phaeovulum sp.]MDP2062610.1 chaperone modulator CbpM [Phaeovulum sp.]MDZ4117932.1 chaperone modulator CbpM [Phaeovulum sp.]
MTDRYSEAEAVAAVARLTRSQLVAFVEAEVVVPERTEAGFMFRQIDLARMELLCELCEQFDLADDALGMVISLVDQMHGLRGELRAVLAAIDAEPDEVRARIAQALRSARIL